jgi:hypothetical protein
MAVSITYSYHAGKNLIDRKIERSWVEQAVENPDLLRDHETDPELEHCYSKIAEKGNRVMHVVFNRNESRVVTAYFDRNMKGKL